VQAREPGRQQPVPARDHRQPRIAREHHARLRRPDHEQRDDGRRRDRRARSKRAEPGAEDLRNWRDQIDLVDRDQGEYRAGAEDEHDPDDRRREPHRSRDRPFGVAAFAGVQGHVFEAAERAEPHLGRDVEAQDRGDGHRRRQRVEFRERAVGDVQPRHDDQQAEGRQHQYAARLVHPFAETQAADRHEHERAEDQDVHERDDPVTTHQGRAFSRHEVVEVLRDLQADLRGVQDREQPQVPRDQEADQIVESQLRPLIQPAFERHRAIEMDDDGGRGQIEKHDRREPEQDVRGALFGGDANPRQADDEQHLRQREIRDTQIPPKLDAGFLHAAHYSSAG